MDKDRLDAYNNKNIPTTIRTELTLLTLTKKTPCSLSPKPKNVFPSKSDAEIPLELISSFLPFSLFIVNLTHNWQYLFHLWRWQLGKLLEKKLRVLEKQTEKATLLKSTDRIDR